MFVKIKQVCFSFSLLFCLFSVNLKAQDTIADFVKINTTFEKIQRFSTLIDYTIYEGFTGSSVLQKYSVKMMKDSLLNYRNSDSTEYISNIDYYLIVKHKEKTITIGKQSLNEPPITLNPVQMQEMLRTSSAVDYIKNNDNTATYTLSFNTGKYAKMALTFGLKTYLLSKIEMFIYTGNSEKPEMRVEIFFKNFNPNPIFNKNQFTYENYMNIYDNKFVVKPSFEGFTIKDLYTDIK